MGKIQAQNIRSLKAKSKRSFKWERAGHHVSVPQKQISLFVFSFSLYHCRPGVVWEFCTARQKVHNTQSENYFTAQTQGLCLCCSWCLARSFTQLYFSCHIFSFLLVFLQWSSTEIHHSNLQFGFFSFNF